ncbi:XVIPCD domain-containing protein [Luteibacter sp. 329MFSha]|uniref:XVIPCD domain-containing protein n=1 Tax=Luteibacter sp. 329MFSha TaxID=1798239 RepID=UPI0008CB69CB|nr:XVIPCD domain-containing protein [Luteibacter sp. 329MFSha]SEV92596.1 Putative peptidoglycan binding domain-containing protein [Luteibacter sp. 329MFSha]
MDDQRDLYAPYLQPRGPAYRDDQVDSRLSHYNDPIDRSPGRFAGNSHIHGDASVETQAAVMDALVEASQRAGLDDKDTAYVLATARFESGFNPDAAAGPTSAYGVGQFVRRTGHSYGISDAQIGDLTRQAEGLVAIYKDNAALARSRGQGDEYIYAYHHDGSHASPEALALSRQHVVPYVPAFERFVAARQEHHERLPADPEFHSRTHVTPEPAQAASHALRHGSHGQAVSDLQTQLAQLGYADAEGRPLGADGRFGAGTQAAVEAFQREHGLAADGIAGARTQEAVANALAQGATRPLDHPDHPDHALFLQVRSHVYRLDADLGRPSDVHSDNLAAGLTVSARQDGLLRVDQIALSDDGSRLWGAQRPPGVRDHFFDRVTSVSTHAAMTPIAETSVQWPQAMQQFQSAQAQQQAEQIQAIQQAPTTQPVPVAPPTQGLSQ